jgi:hypothetical protein
MDGADMESGDRWHEDQRDCKLMPSGGRCVCWPCGIIVIDRGAGHAARGCGRIAKTSMNLKTRSPEKGNQILCGFLVSKFDRLKNFPWPVLDFFMNRALTE